MTTVVGASSSFEPALQACSTLVGQVLAFFQAPDDSEIRSVALNGLNAALDLINSRQWKKIVGAQTITLDNTNNEYDVADEFKDPIRLFKLTSASVKDGRIEFATEARFYEIFETPVASSGEPCLYTYDYAQRKIVLDVVPSSGFTSRNPYLHLRYHRRVGKLNCTGTTGLPPEFDEWLIARAAVWLAAVRDPDRIPYLSAEASDRWRMLIRDDGNIQTDYQ